MVWESLCFLDLDVYFPMLGKFSAIVFKYVLCSLSLSFCDSYERNVTMLDVFSEVSLSLFIFIFYFFSSASVIC